jgi:hypothetical protein
MEAAIDDCPRHLAFQVFLFIGNAKFGRTFLELDRVNTGEDRRVNESFCGFNAAAMVDADFRDNKNRPPSAH